MIKGLLTKLIFSPHLPNVYLSLNILKNHNMAKQLRHDRHTVSLLTDHMVFSPKYRGKVLVGEVAMVAEAIIRKTCKELDIEVIDMAVNPDYVHIFLKYPPKYSVSYISKMI